MIGRDRRAAVAVIGIAIASAAAGWPATARAQVTIRGSSFEQDLLHRIDITQGPLPGDVPRLARLVVLEAISMHQYARRELGASPAGALLVGEIDGLWQEAATFDQIAWATEAGIPVPPGAPQVAFARLDNAYGQVESTLGLAPGLARGAAYRLDRVTRLLAELRPQVGPVVPLVGPAPRPSGPFAEVRRSAQDIGHQVADLRGELRGPDGLADRVAALAEAVREFDGLVAAGPSEEALRTGFRPVRLRAAEVDALVRARPDPPEVASRWRTIRDGIDRLSARFGFPREIVLRPGTPGPAR